jgi:CheY-like chemotaxis protein
MRRVLAVDDEPTILALVRDILGSSGFTVTAVRSAAEALRRMEMDTFDLVITDLRMPEMSGHELIEQLRAHPAYKRTPILVLASGADQADLDPLKVDMRIGKPFAPKTLLSAVTALIG